jgi:hypothetical protein
LIEGRVDWERFEVFEEVGEDETDLGRIGNARGKNEGWTDLGGSVRRS